LVLRTAGSTQNGCIEVSACDRYTAGSAAAHIIGPENRPAAQVRNIEGCRSIANAKCGETKEKYVA
jgi:hypothetical protein